MYVQQSFPYTLPRDKRDNAKSEFGSKICAERRRCPKAGNQRRRRERFAEPKPTAQGSKPRRWQRARCVPAMWHRGRGLWLRAHPDLRARRHKTGSPKLGGGPSRV